MSASGAECGLYVRLRPQRRPLDNLDAGAPRVDDVGDGVAALRIRARRLVEFDAFRLDLLHEGCVVLHVETDVVEYTPSSRRLLGVGLGEPDLYAWEVHDRRVVAGAGLSTEGLRIPSL